MKLKRLLPNIFVLSVIFIFTSCSSVYMPNKQNLPQHKEQGDAVVSSSLGVNGYDIQGNVALTDHVGFMLNASGGYGGFIGTEDFKLKNRMLELGFGAYKVENRFHVLSVYVGGGGGKIYSFYNNLDVMEFESSFTRLFIQPSYVYDTRYGTFGASLRYSYLSLCETEFEGGHSFVEPALTFKFGSENIRFVGQAGFSFYLDAPFNEMEYMPLMMSVGVEFRLGDMMRKATRL